MCVGGEVGDDLRMSCQFSLCGVLWRVLTLSSRVWVGSMEDPSNLWRGLGLLFWDECYRTLAKVKG